jgi:hypothetical protein
MAPGVGRRNGEKRLVECVDGGLKFFVSKHVPIGE